MQLTLKKKILSPLFILAGLIFIFFGFVYYSLNTVIAGLEADGQRLYRIDDIGKTIYRSVQSGILTKEPRYLIETAQASLTFQSTLKELAARFPNETLELSTLHLQYYAKLVSVMSLFNENRTAEANKRLQEIEASAKTMQQALSRLQTQLKDVQNSTTTRINFLLYLFIFLVVGIFLLEWFTVVKVVAPAHASAAILLEIAGGDLTRRLPVTSQDEIGKMAGSFNKVVEDLRAVIGTIASNAKTVASSATELSTISADTLQNVQTMVGKSSEAAIATEEMTANFQSVAVAMEQSTSNVNTIASSTEEMTATIGELTQNAAKALKIAASAVDQSRSASTKMGTLGESARKIGKVTEAITEISEQTNLLALNATIEAARAGEAGKGFAVVANEIKELARQTAAATVDIKNQIGDMQTVTTTTVADIENVSAVIDEINNVINSIANAVEEQSAATKAIASSAARASQGIAEVNQNAAESAEMASAITSNVGEISSQAKQAGEGSAQVQASAQGLAELAVQLENLVAKFKV